MEMIMVGKNDSEVVHGNDFESVAAVALEMYPDSTHLMREIE